MVWIKISKIDGKPRYIKRFGNIVLLTKDKKGALSEVPEGWEVIELSGGHLKIRKKV